MEKINYQGVIKEEVNHPEHYQGNGIEVIDIIDAFDLNFNLGNSIKSQYSCSTPLLTSSTILCSISR